MTGLPEFPTLGCCMCSAAHKSPHNVRIKGKPWEPLVNHRRPAPAAQKHVHLFGRQSMSMPRHSCSMCSRPSWVKTVDMHRASGSVYKQWARLMRDQGARQTSAQLGKDGLHVTMSRNVTHGVLSPLHNVTVHNVSNACPGRWPVAGMTAQNLSPHLASRSCRGNIPWAPAARSP